MRPLYTFTVRPTLPPDLEPLRKLANNLMWSWDHELIALFSRMDPDLWVETLAQPGHDAGANDSRTPGRAGSRR